MAKIKPFPALRPKPDLASRICELPYDVMSSAEARKMAEGNPLSFLHVSKPEIDLPPDVDPHSPEVYAKGRENLERLVAEGALFQDASPGFYLYRQVMGDHRQIGLVAAASCQEYLNGTIRKHEFTRPDKEDDRVRHIDALNAQTGPVFLTYRAVAALDKFVAQRTATPPEVDFTGSDGVRHSSWTVGDSEGIRFVEKEFLNIPSLYVADGHHRSAAAARVFEARRGSGESSRFLSVIFPHNQMQILPYNRVVRDLNGHSPDSLLEQLGRIFEIGRGGNGAVSGKNHVGLFLTGTWFSMQFRPELANAANPIDALDVSLLQSHVLKPLLGIDDPRTSDRIRFVGGIRGTTELERLVNSGENACAFSMHPTSIEDLMTIADADGIMPPKSTWFEPKLRDAMFCHML